MIPERTAKTKHLELQIKEGILYVGTLRGITIDLPTAREIVEERLDFQEKKNYPILARLNIKFANKAARNYMNLKGAEGVKAAAFIADTLAIKTLINFYLLMEKPPVPARYFENEKSAVAWLQTFVDN